MQKLLRVISVILITIMVTSPPAFSGGGFSNSGSSSGGVSSVGDPDSSDSVVGGTYAKQAFDPLGLNGVIRYYVANGQYQNGLNWDYDYANKEINVTGLNGTNRITLPLNADIQTLHAGGTKGIPTYDLTSKLVEYWSLEQSSGTTYTGGLGVQNCTATDEISTDLLTPGAVGYGMAASSGKGADCGGSIGKFTGDFTAVAMYRNREGNEDLNPTIFGNRIGSGTNIGWQLLGNGDGSHTVPLVAQLSIDEGATTYSVLGTTEIDDFSYHVIAGRRSGSTLSIWTDGVSEGTPSGTTSASLASAGNLQIGGAPVHGYIGDGNIDEVYLFDEALTDAEIEAFSAWLLAGGQGPVIYPATGPHVISTSERETSLQGLNDGNDLLIAGSLEVKGRVFGTEQIVSGHVSTSTTTFYCPLPGVCTTTSDGRHNIVKLPFAVRASGFQANFTNAPTAGKSWTCDLRKNGSAVKSTVTISDSETTEQDVTHTDDFAAGDTMGAVCTAAGGPSTSGAAAVSVKLTRIN